MFWSMSDGWGAHQDLSSIELLPKSPKHGVDQRGEYLSADKARFQTEVPADMNTRSYSSINLEY